MKKPSAVCAKAEDSLQRKSNINEPTAETGKCKLKGKGK